MNLINLQNINVSYDKKNNILENLNLQVKKGELVSLLGPSGCGKTTTLRVVAGFIEPTAGKFLLGDEDYTKIPVHNRNFGLVFQSYALFPHLTVEENVAFGLKMKKVSKDEIKVALKFVVGQQSLNQRDIPGAGLPGGFPLQARQFAERDSKGRVGQQRVVGLAEQHIGGKTRGEHHVVAVQAVEQYVALILAAVEGEIIARQRL